MSTIEDVRVAEKKMKDILAGPRKDDLLNSDDLPEDLSGATDEYANPVREAAIVLLTEVSHAPSIARLLRSGVRAILTRESDPEDVLTAIYAA